MRIIPTNRLKIGDWILDKGIGLKRKFRVAKIRGYSVEEWQEIDLIRGEITNLGEAGNCKGVIERDNKNIRVFNKKEIKELEGIKKRFLMLKGLEEEQKEKK